jgi:tRNA G46 methylase TrmB
VIAAWRKWYSQARLMIQDRLLTKGMGGLFPERADLSNLHRILDIGCGPGAWALDMADAYPVT